MFPEIPVTSELQVLRGRHSSKEAKEQNRFKKYDNERT